MRLNIQNVEELIFHNKDIWKKMPELVYLRDQWRMSQMTPILRAMGRKSVLDFLKKAKGVHEDIISEHFGTLVTIEKIERNLVTNLEFSVNDENVDFELEDEYTAFSSYRNGEKVYVTFWR